MDNSTEGHLFLLLLEPEYFAILTRENWLAGLFLSTVQILSDAHFTMKTKWMDRNSLLIQEKRCGLLLNVLQMVMFYR